MNHKLLNKTLRKANQELRDKLKKLTIEVYYLKSKLKLIEKEKKDGNN